MNKIKAKMVGAAGVVNYKKSWAKSFTFVDRFDEPYKNYYRDKQDIWLPRGLCTSKTINYDNGLPVSFDKNFVPRNKDQSKVVAEAKTLLRAGTDFIIEAPTGYGKTYVGAALISEIGRRTLIIVTKEDIIGDTDPPTQWMKALMEVCGLTRDEIGIWRGDKTPAMHHKVVIGLVQSIRKGPDRYDRPSYLGFGLVICDEVHRMGAEAFSQAMWWLPAKLRLGLSATPDRIDGRAHVFVDHIGPVQVVAKQDVMVPKIIVQQTGWKVPMVYWEGEYRPMPHTHGKTMNLDKAMGGDKARNGVISKFVQSAYKKGRNTIVFSSRVGHLEMLYEVFREGGIPSHKMGYYVGLQNYEKGLTRAEKLRLRDRAKACPVILATYQMASEATDIPWLDTAVFGTPRANIIQVAGRIRRFWEGKKQPVIFDLVDASSFVLKDYWEKRQAWYRHIGAPIVYM